MNYIIPANNPALIPLKGTINTAGILVSGTQLQCLYELRTLDSDGLPEIQTVLS